MELICIGYKYNTKKVLTFVLTKGAGYTESGIPYEAEFNDYYGNIHIRYVGRPKVISTCFKQSIIVDVLNQARPG